MIINQVTKMIISASSRSDPKTLYLFIISRSSIHLLPVPLSRRMKAESKRNEENKRKVEEKWKLEVRRRSGNEREDEEDQAQNDAQ